MNNTEKTMDKIIALCKNRGFIFAGSEIYGGLANTWDYGPLGTRLKNNVKDAWRKRFIQERRNSFEVTFPASPIRCSTAGSARCASAPTI